MELIVKLDKSKSGIISPNESRTSMKVSNELERLRGSISFTSEEIENDQRLAHILDR